MSVQDLMQKIEAAFWERKRQEYRQDFIKAINRVFVGDVRRKNIMKAVEAHMINARERRGAK
jgi:hypothetical protein